MEATLKPVSRYKAEKTLAAEPAASAARVDGVE
jgi:hypothetical protein